MNMVPPKIKLAVFGTSSFLGWTEGFETRLFSGRNTNLSLFGKASYVLQRERRIRKLSKWADVVFCEFLSPVAMKVSHVSPKPIIIRIHRAELDKPERFDGVDWDNVWAIVADSNHYANLIRDIVPTSVQVVSIPPGVDQHRWPYHPSSTKRICTWGMPVRRKRIYSLMLALAGHHTLYVAGHSAVDRINSAANARFALGHVLEPDAKFPEWQWDKEFYIHHALDEGLAVAIQESMLSGLIPVVHRIPMSLELVPEELTYVHDSELLDRLDGLMEMEETERNRIKERLRKKAMENLTNEVVHERKRELFEEYMKSN